MRSIERVPFPPLPADHPLLTVVGPRGLVFVDIETTELSVAAARIVQLGLIRVCPDGFREAVETLVDPGVPITPSATATHGLTDADLAGAPRFAEIASVVAVFIADADLAGFNLERFDVPVLQRELADAGEGITLGEGRVIIDVLRLYHKLAPRNLASAHLDYCGRPLEGAHGALADAQAVLDVLDAQLARHPELPRSAEGLEAFTRDPQAVDRDGRFVWAGGEVTFNFGQMRGRTLRQVAQEKPDYLQWILRSDGFPAEVKELVRQALAGQFPVPPEAPMSEAP